MRSQNGTKVLVAGGAGFIGSNLILNLLSRGAQITATLHKRPAQISDERVRFVQADLSQPADCRLAVEGQDIVFICAANTSGAAVIAKTPLVHVTPNVLLNSMLLNAAYECGVKKAVFISCSAAYPDRGSRPLEEHEMFDGDPPEIYYPVGWMKRYTEILCRMYAEKIKNPMSAVVVRASNMYGPYDNYDFETSHMMAAFIRRCAERHSPFVVWGSGQDARDLLYIDDFIEGMVAAAETYENFAAVNLAAGKVYSVKEILEILLHEGDHQQAEVRLDASKPSMIPVRVVSIQKAQKDLGFTAKTSLKEGIRKTLDWYRAHKLEPQAKV